MKMAALYILAFTGGVFLAIQAAFNTQLGAILKQPLIAVVAASITSAVFGGLLLVFYGKENLQVNIAQQVPWYLWFIGGIFSMVGITLYFYTIPKLGISKMIALGLCGQLVFSLIAGKFGWLNLPVEPITLKRTLGVMAMIIGIILINSK